MRAALALVFVLCALAPAASAQVGPGIVCATNAVPMPTRESRIFCEPLDSVGFVQFDQFVAGLHAIEEAAPDYIEVREVGTSVGGLPIYFVEVTNEGSSVPRAQKLQLGYSASIHANEAAGREGMSRVIEDLAMGRGPFGAELKPLLDRVIVNVWFPNPDNWAAGDYFDADAIAGVHPAVDPSCTGPLGAGVPVCGYQRENAHGVDLNRQFPNPGWILPEHKPMDEPESRAVVSELRYSGNHTNLVAGADLHGMLNSPNMVRSIIPNQDYDFRRMVLVVDQLRTTQARVEQDPAYMEWQTADEVADGLGFPPLPVQPCVPAPALGDVCADDLSDVHDKPFLWGARWDQIGYTDSGFTSDYLTLSPRSPTGGMGAVGTIVEFAYSHMVPDNHYVAKLTDMHVAGVREIVRTQMEMALRTDTPILAGTGKIAYLESATRVTSANDPNAYGAGKPAFDVADPEARFDFQQVPYDVANTDFWRDLAPFTEAPVVAVDAAGAAALPADVRHLVLTDQTVEQLGPAQANAILQWVQAGGHLVLTDRALQWLERVGLVDQPARELCVYIGHSDLQDRGHPLLADVDWNARVTAEASATGFEASAGEDWNYPEWGVAAASVQGRGGDVVGTTVGHEATSAACANQTTDTLATMGRIPYGAGKVDFIGAALPQPTQLFDHRYGLAPYSVSALTYWFFMNSFGGHVAWQDNGAPFVPQYPYDPLYGATAPTTTTSAEATPSPGVLLAIGAVGLCALRLRRRTQA